MMLKQLRDAAAVQLAMSSFDGTYSFCRGCPRERNCCVRVRPSGSINRPILFLDEVRRIERHTGKQALDFSTPLGLQSHTRLMKSTSLGCLFCQGGKCAIYKVRPLDCRLFPFDLIEKPGGAIVWIVYTAVCPVKFDVQGCLKKAKALLPQLGQNTVEYARADAPWKNGEPYVELGPL